MKYDALILAVPCLLASTAPGLYGQAPLKPAEPATAAAATHADAVARTYAGTSTVREPAHARRNAFFFPGGGHFYSGESTKGAILLGGAVGSVVLGALLSSSGGPCQATGPEDDNCVYNHETHEMRERPNRTPLLVGGAGSLLIWGYGVADAAASAGRMNRRNGFSVGSVPVEPMVGVTPRGAALVGMRLSR